MAVGGMHRDVLMRRGHRHVLVGGAAVGRDVTVGEVGGTDVTVGEAGDRDVTMAEGCHMDVLMGGGLRKVHLVGRTATFL